VQAAEASALAAGQAWRNFRATHSDGREYGDLDPRFLDAAAGGAAVAESAGADEGAELVAGDASACVGAGPALAVGSGGGDLRAPFLSVRPTTARERQRRAPRLLKGADGGVLPWVVQWRRSLDAEPAALRASDTKVRDLASLEPAAWRCDGGHALCVAIVLHMSKLRSKDDYIAR
jgi:hypothetical protein